MRRTIEDSKNLVEKMLEDTAKTVDSVKHDIEKTIVDYTFVPGKDIIETDDSVIVHLDIPGVKKEDIDLKVTEMRMKVTAKLDEEHMGRSSYVTHYDRKSGFIKRTVRFPRKVLPKEAEAKYENGVLTVEVPKLDKTEGFKVDIK